MQHPRPTIRHLRATYFMPHADYFALNKPTLHLGNKNIPILRIAGMDAQENRFMT